MSTMRDLLLRAQIDPAFADLVQADPNAAIAQYELTDTQIAVIRNPGPGLYRYLVPSFRLATNLSLDPGPDPDPEPPPHPDPPEEPTVLPPLTAPDTTLPDLSHLTVTHPLTQPPDEDVLVVLAPKEILAKRAELTTAILAATGVERVAKLTELMGYVG